MVEKDKSKKNDFLSSLKVDVNQQSVTKNVEKRPSLSTQKENQGIELVDE